MLFQKLINRLKSGGTGQQIMPGVAGKLLADMGLTEMGPNRYDQWRQSHPPFINFDTPYGPAPVPRQRAKQIMNDKARAKRGRFVGPFPTHGKQ